MILARPACATAHVVLLPMIKVSDFIHGHGQEMECWDVEIPGGTRGCFFDSNLGSESISTTRYLCVSYTNNNQYKIKLGYWIATNIVNQESESIYSKSNINQFWAFVRKLRHLQRYIILYERSQHNILWLNRN